MSVSTISLQTIVLVLRTFEWQKNSKMCCHIIALSERKDSTDSLHANVIAVKPYDSFIGWVDLQLSKNI
jgi:hypothetical protein